MHLASRSPNGICLATSDCLNFHVSGVNGCCVGQLLPATCAVNIVFAAYHCSTPLLMGSMTTARKSCPSCCQQTGGSVGLQHTVICHTACKCHGFCCLLALMISLHSQRVGLYTQSTASHSCCPHQGGWHIYSLYNTIMYNTITYIQ